MGCPAGWVPCGLSSERCSYASTGGDTALSLSSACRTSSMEACLWTSCTLPDQHHPTQATGPQFLACTCVEVEPTLVSRAGSQDPPGGAAGGEHVWKRCKGSTKRGGGRVHCHLPSHEQGGGAAPIVKPWDPFPGAGAAHCSPLLLLCRRRSDGSSRTQRCPGGP